MKIFAKLFLLLLGISIVPLSIVGGAVYWRSSALQKRLLKHSAETGSSAAGASERALLREAQRAHLELVKQKADDLYKFFEDGRITVQLFRTMLKLFLTQPLGEKMPPQYSDAEMAQNMKDSSFVSQMDVM